MVLLDWGGVHFCRQINGAKTCKCIISTNSLDFIIPVKVASSSVGAGVLTVLALSDIKVCNLELEHFLDGVIYTEHSRKKHLLA